MPFKMVFLGCPKIGLDENRITKALSPPSRKNTHFQAFLGIFRLFGAFSGTILRTPQRTRLFCDFGPGGRGDSWLPFVREWKSLKLQKEQFLPF